MNFRPRTGLKAKVERDLLAYTAAASAAGAGLLALNLSAEGKVVYTPANVLLENGTIYKLDLNRDGITDFVLKNKKGCGSSDCVWFLSERSPHKNAVIGTGTLSFIPSALALPKGAKIGPGGAFYSLDAFLAGYFVSGGGHGTFGHWANVNKHYLGLKFKLNGKYHYGWARLNVSVHPRKVVGKLTGYAYETVPGKAIAAGDRGLNQSSASSQPLSLGHLAAGALGLRSEVAIQTK